MPTTKKYTSHRCASCGGRLAVDRFIYSRHTGSRYHWPGECRGERRRRRRDSA